MAIRNGWLALVVSVALHGALVGALCLLPGRAAQRAPTEGPEFYEPGGSKPVAMAFVVSRNPDVRDVTLAPPLPTKAAAMPVEPKSVPGPELHDFNPAKPDMAPGSQRTQVQPGGGAAGSAGPGTATTFFQVPARGLTVIYLIDTSASMGPNGALARARQELLASLQRLPANVRFQIIVFNRSANPLLPRFQHWLTPDPVTLEQVAAKLTELRAEGGTDHVQALYRALADQPDVIFFLTDAGDLAPNLVPEVARRNQNRTAIHVIELGDGSPGGGGRLLQMLAHDNRGTYRPVDLARTP